MATTSTSTTTSTTTSSSTSTSTTITTTSTTTTLATVCYRISPISTGLGVDDDALLRTPHPASYEEALAIEAGASGLPIEEGLPKARWEFKNQIFSAADWNQLRKYITPRGYGRVYIRTRTNQISGGQYECSNFRAIMKEPEGSPIAPWRFNDVAVDFTSLESISGEEVFRDHFEDGEVHPALWAKTEQGTAKIEERAGTSFLRFIPRGQDGTLLRGNFHMPYNLDWGLESRFRCLYTLGTGQPDRKFEVLRIVTDISGDLQPVLGVEIDPFSLNLFCYCYFEGAKLWYDPVTAAWQAVETNLTNIQLNQWFVAQLASETYRWRIRIYNPDGSLLHFTFFPRSWYLTDGSCSTLIPAIGDLDHGLDRWDIDYFKAYTPYRTYTPDPDQLS